MEKYETVEIEIIKFDNEDIITTSPKDILMPEMPAGNN